MQSSSSKLKLPVKDAKEQSTVNPALIALFNAPPPLPAKKKSPPPPPPSPRVPAAADGSNKRKQVEDGKKKSADANNKKEGGKKADTKNKKQKKNKKQEDDKGVKEAEQEETKKAEEEKEEAEAKDEDSDNEENDEGEEEGEGADNEKKKECTLFVGNVPVSMTKKEIRRIFAPYGKIQSIRFRSVAFAFPKRKNEEKKAAFLGKHFHPDRDTCNVYIVFAEKDSALKALAANNTKIELDEGVAHLSVDLAYAPTWNMARAAFVGNLPFSIKDEELRSHFESAGTVKRVRIVRDPATFMGKGFGFVEFENKDDLLGALALHESEFQGRQIRVFKASNQQQQGGRKGPSTKSNSKGGAGSRPYQGMQSVQGAALRVERKRKRMENGGGGKPKRSGGGPKGKQAGGGRPKKARTGL